MNKNAALYKRLKVYALTGVLVFGIFSILGTAHDRPDPPREEILPDFVTRGLSVRATTTGAGFSKWTILLTVDNTGGIKGLVDTNGNPYPTKIPVIARAFFPANRPTGCFTNNIDNSSPYNHYENVEAGIFLGSGTQIGFQDVFTFYLPITNDCIPSKVFIQFNYMYPGFTNLYQEPEYSNNNIEVNISNWPQTRQWDYP